MPIRKYPDFENGELESPHSLNNGAEQTGLNSDGVNRATRRRLAFALPVGVIAAAIALNPSKAIEVATVAYDTSKNWVRSAMGDNPGSKEICDGLDNDRDGETDEGCDCIDGSTRICGSSVGECIQGTKTCVAGNWPPFCHGNTDPVSETCNDLDDDCNGLADDGIPCNSPVIHVNPVSAKSYYYIDEGVIPAASEMSSNACSNGLDDDNDRLTDCADPDCDLYCALDESSPSACSNKVDDDNDGLVDCADSNCITACATVTLK